MSKKQIITWQGILGPVWQRQKLPGKFRIVGYVSLNYQ